MQRHKKTMTFCLGDIAIDSDAIKAVLWVVPEDIEIDAIWMGVSTLCTAADTNYNTFAVTDITNNIATLANGPVATGITLAAGVPQEMTKVAAQLDRDAGDVLQFEAVKTGNGLALVGLTVQIDYYARVN